MSITAIPSTVPTPVARTPEVKEGPGPDRDGDADDKSTGPSAGVAATPPGMGAVVNSKA